MNWEGSGRNLYANIGDCSGVYLVGLRKTTKKTSVKMIGLLKTEVLLTRSLESDIQLYLPSTHPSATYNIGLKYYR
jgi:hypothetical protein